MMNLYQNDDLCIQIDELCIKNRQSDNPNHLNPGIIYCEFRLKWPGFQWKTVLKMRPFQSKFAVNDG